MVFAEELEGLAERPPLRIVHLPGRPRRRLDASLLRELLGAGRRRMS